jgi:nucleoside-diphosphate-sugar epimerase
VFAVARLRDPSEVAQLRAIGATPVPFDAGSHDVSGLPDDIDVVIHLAARTPVREPRTSDDQRMSIEVNAHGTGRLISRYRDASAFVFASTSSVYLAQEHPMVESDLLGVAEHFANGYVLSKIIGESIVTFASQEWGTPATIVRIAQMYGPRGGAPTVRLDRVRRGATIPVYGDQPNPATIMFEDDYVDKLIAAVHVAATPPVVTNFASTQTTIQEYCTIAGELLDVDVRFVTSEHATRPIPVDLTRMHELLGSPRTSLRDGIARTLEVPQEGRASGWASFDLPGE